MIARSCRHILPSISPTTYNKNTIPLISRLARSSSSTSAAIMGDNKKPSKFAHLPLATSGPVECALKGTPLLNHPYFNKGSAFTQEEREQFELTGLLPPSIQSLEQQVKRAYQQYSTRPDDLAKNTFLSSMKEQNEVLYYKVWTSHLRALALSTSEVKPQPGTNTRCSSCMTTWRRCSALSTRPRRATQSRTTLASSDGPRGVSLTSMTLIGYRMTCRCGGMRTKLTIL
jgi:hypothetical protein